MECGTGSDVHVAQLHTAFVSSLLMLSHVDIKKGAEFPSSDSYLEKKKPGKMISKIDFYFFIAYLGSDTVSENGTNPPLFTSSARHLLR